MLYTYYCFGALAEKLGTALQKLVDGSVTRTHLQYDLRLPIYFNENYVIKRHAARL